MTSTFFNWQKQPSMGMAANPLGMWVYVQKSGTRLDEDGAIVSNITKGFIALNHTDDVIIRET